MDPDRATSRPRTRAFASFLEHVMPDNLRGCSSPHPKIAPYPQDASSPFDGWERYPSNISSIDTLCDDGVEYNNRLGVLSSSLFSNKVALLVIDASGGYTRFGVTVRTWGIRY